LLVRHADDSDSARLQPVEHDILPLFVPAES
jgi:hypothetical protein